MGFVERFIRGLFALTSSYKRAALEREIDRDPEMVRMREELSTIKARIDEITRKYDNTHPPV